jgi:class 3 adenylate cyclase
MIPHDAQRALAEHYGGGMVKKAFDKTLMEGFQVEFDREREEWSAAVFIDIAGFSRKVDGQGPAEVREYLDAYYAAVLPVVFNRGGMIDRIAGDGVIAIFSTVFGLASARTAEDKALDTAEEAVRQLRGSSHEVKAAISTGPLLYCRTGIATVFEEFTVIGAPLTELYRIEEVSQANEVVLRADSDLGKRTHQEAYEATRRRELGLAPPFQGGWNVERDEGTALRGVNGGRPVPLLREHYRPTRSG